MNKYYNQGFTAKCKELNVDPKALVKLAQDIPQADLAQLYRQRPMFRGMPFSGAYRQSTFGDTIKGRSPTGKLTPVYSGAYKSTLGEKAIDGLTTGIHGGFNSQLPVDAKATAYRYTGPNAKTRNYERGWFGRKKPVFALDAVTPWKGVN